MATTSIAWGAIEQPVPLMPGSLVESGRNPFSTPKKRLSNASYGKVVEGCQLRGIIKVGGQQIALFVVQSEEGAQAKKEEIQLRRVRVGDKIRVLGKDEEHLLTLRQLGERSAVIVGENNQQYKVWL
ncbi:hypothetical protein JWJ90_00980 [Desulfobulbus rhabdoformis]|uniref:hypothetical protein n=1 Tax=Desulfobulbus rhabdoformis TaxID=34032 RepID=UPI0019653964|nr:hypothetical protein [Desulfobulbus rhabdoformis]MBM9612854.1 hypothetical protein [Desulfobulbus rhabdoformis]